jgi:hypothetical protein
MKKLIILSVLSAFIIIACNNNNKTGKLLQGPDDMTSTEYVINIERDTTLETTNGALLKIPRGSLKTDKGNTVKLEIKEAYSIAQMIKAGLTTQSNGDPLSSGGMIYINAAEGQNVTITQPLQVALPAAYLNKSMQLFKGERDSAGNINWKEPVALPENKQLSVIEQGRSLFQGMCASCHGIGKDMTGPDLAHFMKRFPLNNPGNEKYYLHLSSELYFNKADSIKKTGTSDYLSDVIYAQSLEQEHETAFNTYKCNLQSKYRTRGPYFPSDDSERTGMLNIYKYIQNESDRLDLAIPWQTSLFDCADSCKLYKETTEKLRERKASIEAKRKDLVIDNGPLVDSRPDSIMPTGDNGPINFEEKVNPANYDAEYYQFSITSFGWYNIDALMNGVEGVKESELYARITGDYRQRIKTYLIIPSVKSYGEGGPADRNPEEFAFFYKNGKLPLPQNVKAYILAVTDSEDSPVFGITEFTTSLSQTIDVSLHKGSKEEFDKAIDQLGADRLHIKVADAKNADAIRKTSTDLKAIEEDFKKAEGLKPKNCDCDCGSAKPDTAGSRSLKV